MTESLDEEKEEAVALAREKQVEHKTRANVHFNVDVVPCDDLLPTNGADLDLHVDDTEGLRADVDLNQTWVDGLVELAEP